MRANNKERYNRWAGAIRGNLVVSQHTACTHTHMSAHSAVISHCITLLCTFTLVLTFALSISLPCSLSMTSNGLELTKEERECCQLPQ